MSALLKSQYGTNAAPTVGNNELPANWGAMTQAEKSSFIGDCFLGITNTDSSATLVIIVPKPTHPGLFRHTVPGQQVFQFGA